MRVEVGWEDHCSRPVDRILQSLGQIPHELTLITDRISSQEFQSALQKQREAVSKSRLKRVSNLLSKSDHPRHLLAAVGGGAVFVLTFCSPIFLSCQTLIHIC